jgi:hypothetical protein
MINKFTRLDKINIIFGFIIMISTSNIAYFKYNRTENMMNDKKNN